MTPVEMLESTIWSPDGRFCLAVLFAVCCIVSGALEWWERRSEIGVDLYWAEGRVVGGITYLLWAVPLYVLSK